MAWLIERREPTRFLALNENEFYWAETVDEAFRLARKEDADALIRVAPWIVGTNYPAIACEHAWVDA